MCAPRRCYRWQVCRRLTRRRADVITSPLSDEFYLPVYPPSVVQPVAPTPDWQQVPLPCLDDIIGSGTSCTSGWKAEQHIDFVWTWVNSSDPLWSKARASISAQLVGKSGEVNMDNEQALTHFRYVLHAC